MKSLITAAAVAAVVTASLAGTAQAQSKADTLRVGINSGPVNLADPFRARGVPSIYFKQALYESLTNIDDKGSIVPALVESWQLVDNTTWRLKIRDGAMFTNGRKNDAANIAANMDWLLNDETGKTMQLAGVIKDVATATALDGNVLEIKTKVPQPILAAVLSELFPVELGAWKDMGNQQYAAQPVTSGPWKADLVNSEEVRGTAWDGAFQKAGVKHIRLLGMPEAATRTQAIESDQMDVTTNMSPDDIERLKAAGHEARVFDAPQTMTVAFYEQKEGFNPFKDRRVRLAANMAIDRDSIVENLMYGLSKPAHQAATPNTFGYNPNIKPYPYDPEGAKKLLAEAGYADGFDTVLEVVTGSLPNDTEIYTLVGDMLTKVGIRTEVRRIVLADLAAKLFKRSGAEWEGHLFGFSAFVDPHLDAERPFQQHGCTFKPSWICLQSVEALRDKANATMDREERRKVLMELLQTAHDEGAALHIQHGVDIYGINKRVKNFTNWNRRLIFENITF